MLRAFVVALARSVEYRVALLSGNDAQLGAMDYFVQGVASTLPKKWKTK